MPRRLIFYPLWQAYYMISQVRDQADFLVMEIQFGLLVPFFFSTHIYLKHRNVEDTEQHVVTQFELTNSLVNGNHRSEIMGISGLWKYLFWPISSILSFYSILNTVLLAIEQHVIDLINIDILPVILSLIGLVNVLCNSFNFNVSRGLAAQ